MDNTTINNKQLYTVNKPKGIKVRLSTILIGIMCFIMVLPDDVFGVISLYRSRTPSSISYIWLDYSFGIVQLFVLVIGAYYAVKMNKKNMIIIMIIMFLRELIFLFVSDNNIFVASAYEMYLALLVGYSFVLWAEGGLKNKNECERYYKWFIVSNMLTLYINYAMGGAGGVIAGRYHSSNLDVGGTGTVCVLCILFLGFSQVKRWYDYLFIVLSLIGLFLSGSRSNLLFLILLIAFYALFKMFIRFKNEEVDSVSRNTFFRRFLISLIVIIAMIVLLFLNIDKITNLVLGSRFQALFNSRQFQTDDSFVGRMTSIVAGLDILKQNPFGIAGYFINLQSEIRLRGFPTFPHSTLLSMYLIFGPIVLVLLLVWIKQLKKLKSLDAKYFLMILFLLISSIVYGGPIVNFKVIFIILMTTALAKMSITDSFEKEKF